MTTHIYLSSSDAVKGLTDFYQKNKNNYGNVLLFQVVNSRAKFFAEVIEHLPPSTKSLLQLRVIGNDKEDLKIISDLAARMINIYSPETAKFLTKNPPASIPTLETRFSIEPSLEEDEECFEPFQEDGKETPPKMKVSSETSPSSSPVLKARKTHFPGGLTAEGDICLDDVVVHGYTRVKGMISAQKTAFEDVCALRVHVNNSSFQEVRTENLRIRNSACERAIVEGDLNARNTVFSEVRVSGAVKAKNSSFHTLTTKKKYKPVNLYNCYLDTIANGGVVKWINTRDKFDQKFTKEIICKGAILENVNVKELECKTLLAANSEVKKVKMTLSEYPVCSLILRHAIIETLIIKDCKKTIKKAKKVKSFNIIAHPSSFLYPTISNRKLPNNSAGRIAGIPYQYVDNQYVEGAMIIIKGNGLIKEIIFKNCKAYAIKVADDIKIEKMPSI